jgi:hypothetical protein
MKGGDERVTFIVPTACHDGDFTAVDAATPTDRSAQGATDGDFAVPRASGSPAEFAYDRHVSNTVCGVVRIREPRGLTMPILPISRSVFDQLHPNRSPSWKQEEVEWLAERSRALIGYIARNHESGRDAQSEDWSIVIEGRDERGEFHLIDSNDHLPSQRDARALLEKRMNELLATGLKVFPRRAGAAAR